MLHCLNKSKKDFISTFCCFQNSEKVFSTNRLLGLWKGVLAPPKFCQVWFSVCNRGVRFTFPFRFLPLIVCSVCLRCLFTSFHILSSYLTLGQQLSTFFLDQSHSSLTWLSCYWTFLPGTPLLLPVLTGPLWFIGVFLWWMGLTSWKVAGPEPNQPVVIG